MIHEQAIQENSQTQLYFGSCMAKGATLFGDTHQDGTRHSIALEIVCRAGFLGGGLVLGSRG